MTSARRPPDPVFTLRGSGCPITCLKFSDQWLFSGSEDGTVHIWDLRTRRPLGTLPAHPGHSVLWIEFFTNDQMVTFGKNGVANVWRAAESSWKCTDEIKTSAMGFCPGAMLKHDNLLALPSDKTSAVDLYDIKTLKKVGSLYDTGSNFGMTMSLKSVSETSQFFVGYEDGSVGLWDSKQSQILDKTKFFHDCVMCLDYNSVANLGICGSPSNELATWNIAERLINRTTNLGVTNPGFNDVRIRDDHKIIATAGWDHQVRIFGVRNMKPLAVLSYHKDSVQCLAFSNDNLLACGSKDQHISLWKIF
ncbi:guanine nucleotide-binding protein subunit beta-like protein 1 isoform X2 [Ostrea edulis]|nr:guanine nucleotide-binding protein subunit beta-like protein 1 isoform X2 [Ostrea edulis]XP_048737633.1 guanine nucleotide-binding protein subunit beta-like protein 1 isoform X2 [Ostrea edulis]